MDSPWRGVAKVLGLVEQTLRNWVNAAAAGRLARASKVVTSDRQRPTDSQLVALIRASHAGLKAVRFECLEVFYNRKRLH